MIIKNKKKGHVIGWMCLLHGSRPRFWVSYHRVNGNRRDDGEGKKNQRRRFITGADVALLHSWILTIGLNYYRDNAIFWSWLRWDIPFFLQITIHMWFDIRNWWLVKYRRSRFNRMQVDWFAGFHAGELIAIKSILKPKWIGINEFLYEILQIAVVALVLAVLAGESWATPVAAPEARPLGLLLGALAARRREIIQQRLNNVYGPRGPGGFGGRYNDYDRGYGGYNQGGYNQGGYNQGGYNQGGYNQGGYNQSEFQ